MKNLLLLLLTSIISVASAQDIDTKLLVNSWKFVKMGDAELPEDLTMIAKISESTITIGSQISVTSWNYELDENNNLVLKLEEGQEEKWEIKKLTETEFIFSEGEVGNFYLVRTDEELPAVVAPVEEEPLEEPMIYNIETDYKASKKTGKLLQHKWDVQSVSGQPAPEGVTLSIEFKKDSKVVLVSNGNSIERGSWKLGKDGKKIEVKDKEDGSEEVWGIKVLDKDKLIIIDQKSGEIAMKKAAKTKK
jgi:hypothetical protein